MKAVDRLGNVLGIGSVVLGSSGFHKSDPMFDYRIVCGNEPGEATKLRLLVPTKVRDKITCTVRVIEGEIVKDGNNVLLQFKNIMVITAVPESISNRLYQAVLHRASLKRGH